MVKNKIITTRTTEDLHRRFTRICEKKGLKGDDWIVLFIGHFENDQDHIQSQIAAEKMKIRKINNQIADLENQKISCENLLEELNSKRIDSGTSDIDKAVSKILYRYDSQSVYSISEFLELNQRFLEQQAFLAGVNVDVLCEKVLSCCKQ